MEENSAYAEEQLLKKDVWAFIRATARHWHLWLGYFFGLGVVCILALEEIVIPHWAVPWLAASGLVIGAFFAWREERRLKEKAELTVQSPVLVGEKSQKKETATPPTLHERFSTDFPYLATGSTAVMHKMDSNKTPIATIEYKSWHAADANAEFLSIYIPKCSDTFGLCVTLVEVYRDLLSKIHSGSKVVQGNPADLSSNPSDNLVFTNKIYIYHEDELSLEQLGLLDGLYKSKKLFPQFRGFKYSTVKWLQTKSK